MNDLVFLPSQRVDAEPFTTGDVIAKYACVTHHAVNQLIATYQVDLEEFGVMAFEMLKPNKGSVGGRPRKVWHLSQQQATVLITYLGNTRPVREFKKALVHQFYAMQRELIERRARFELGKDFSKGLNTAVTESHIEMHGHQYSVFNRLIYKQALGVDSIKLRKIRGIPQAEPITHYLTSEEAEAVRLIKQRVTTFLRAGMDYKQIKQVLGIKGIIYQVQLTPPVKDATPS